MLQERIVIADGQPLFREALARLFLGNESIVQVDYAATIVEAVQISENGPTPNMLILDFGYSGDSLELDLSELRERFKHAFLILTSAINDISAVQIALASGMNGFISKSLSGEEIWSALESVRRGNTVVRLDAADRIRHNSQSTGKMLTNRQNQILDLLSRGLSNKEIGNELKISPFTVSVHVSALLKATGLKSRAAAAGQAHRLRENYTSFSVNDVLPIPPGSRRY